MFLLISQRGLLTIYLIQHSVKRWSEIFKVIFKSNILFFHNLLTDRLLNTLRQAQEYIALTGHHFAKDWFHPAPSKIASQVPFGTYWTRMTCIFTNYALIHPHFVMGVECFLLSIKNSYTTEPQSAASCSVP